ncbi:hypothetical protein [Sphingomonas sp. M1-B02]|uniref:hypothetical protein n=1 Tax=Sphingomonas sp. M1-B02 TaxID=3114300 RepID=UPI00223F9141|nr:hypothetical protein [Sphingomonas sp. S6-11]UZK65346.1 hypothetical protein OKW87_12590 [Sphingomonas sp. S6-11]
MRVFLIAAASCAIAAPAAAQSRSQLDMVQSLNQPIVQEGVAAMVGAVADIVLDTRIAPLTRHIDGMPPTDTLRDLQRRTNPHFEAELRDRTRRAVATAGIVAGDAVAMTSELKRGADRLQALLGPLAAAIKAQVADDDY